MRPIDADALEAEFAGRPPDWYSTGTILRSIDSAPAIDAVPVVRCRECIHWVGDFPGATKHVKRCEWAGYMVGENGYCVYGERKEGDHE